MFFYHPDKQTVILQATILSLKQVSPCTAPVTVISEEVSLGSRCAFWQCFLLVLRLGENQLNIEL